MANGISAERRHTAAPSWGILVLGAGMGIGLLWGALPAFLIILAAFLVLLISRRPEVGLLLTVAAVPLDRLGGLTEMDATLSVSVAKILGLFTLGSWLFTTLMQRRKICLPTEFLVLIAFGLVGGLTVFSTSDVEAWVVATFSSLSTFTFYFLVVNLVASQEWLRKVLIAFLISTTAMGLFSLAQRHLPAFSVVDTDIHLDPKAEDFIGVYIDTFEKELVGDVPRSAGATTQPDYYALNLIIVIPLLVYFAAVSSGLAKVAATGASAIALLNLFFTHSRGGFLVLLLASVLLLAKGIVKLTPLRAVAVLVALGMLLALLPASVHQRVLDPGSYTFASSASFRARLDLMQAGLGMLREHWLLGMGRGNLTEIQRFYDIKLPIGMHNTYLQIFNETGIFGFAFLLLFWYLCWRAFGVAEQAWRERQEVPMALLASALKISFVSALAYGMVIDLMDMSAKDWWLITALAVAVKRSALEAHQ